MKIVYSAGNRVGADLLLNRFLCGIFYPEHCEVKIAAYDVSSISLKNIDWTLDAIYNKFTGCDRKKLSAFFGKSNLPMMGFEQSIRLMKEIDEFRPDLIICDYEPIVSNIASVLGIPLWYYSPVHLLDGVNWKKGQMRYTGLLEVTRKNLSNLPKADRTIVVSPFAMIDGVELKEGYEWMIPWSKDFGYPNKGSGICLTNDSNRLSELSKILNCIPPYDLSLFSTHKYSLSHLESYLLDDIGYETAVGCADWMFCGGESVFIMDGIYNRVSRFCVSPSLNDPEAMLNGILVKEYGLGDDLGQVEYLEYMSVEEIEKSYKNRFSCKYNKRAENMRYLHEEINE